MKIKDKLFLGAVAGMGGHLVKTVIGITAKSLNLSEINGAERASGMLLPSYQIGNKKGQLVGYLADATMSGVLGVITVIGLSIFGTNNAAIKGALTGQGMWTLLYGVMGTLGATKVNPVSPKTVLSELVGHTGYGVTTAVLISKLADPNTFEKQTPQVQTPQAQVQSQSQPQS